jgi:hypothetical protein
MKLIIKKEQGYIQVYLITCDIRQTNIIGQAGVAHLEQQLVYAFTDRRTYLFQRR